MMHEVLGGMALVKELYPCVADIDGEIKYALGAIPMPRKKETTSPTVLDVADSSAQLGRLLGMQYFSRGGAPIIYEIPTQVKKSLNIVRALTDSEQEEFFEQFRRLL